MWNSSDKQIAGWIGLGKMGIPMPKNLLKADYVLIVKLPALKGGASLYFEGQSPFEFYEKCQCHSSPP